MTGNKIPEGTDTRLRLVTPRDKLQPVIIRVASQANHLIEKMCVLKIGEKVPCSNDIITKMLKIYTIMGHAVQLIEINNKQHIFVSPQNGARIYLKVSGTDDSIDDLGKQISDGELEVLVKGHWILVNPRTLKKVESGQKMKVINQ